ncbi:MAG: adenosylcobinamide-phosphate synthase CbiB [Syntrophomonadaceae bacterium]|nr:adenosylcobinamide-phosphate synthase CbiB [Syntrophomonadaceae bacterium]MDD3889133.1 adenosylcobinamide-phosphate synthase CbiB [Syntrophomonadaceae bacterium]MDD4549547.1 adenosylcobinamide-phosphate synthase CbiB [Syntrophomonadaceae bacterium]
MLWLIVPIALLIDLLWGDPSFIPHPVKIIGRAITAVEKFLRPLTVSKRSERFAGCFLALVIPGIVYIMTLCLCGLAGQIHHHLAILVSAWLISTTIAVRGLTDVGRLIYKYLSNGEQEQARKVVEGIVGRDTANMNEQEMVRATVETMAENIVDAVVAPIFFAFIGGAPLAMTYRAINTLDSMVGYRNDRYLNFGWASARLDDLVNYIPARITGVLIIIVAVILRYRTMNAVVSIFRDSKKHPSPNSGIPESGVAGALGISLGGTNYYDGIPSFRPLLGTPSLKGVEHDDIKKTIKFVYLTGILAVLLGSYLYWFIHL